jgi:hypothetical protein
MLNRRGIIMIKDDALASPTGELPLVFWNWISFHNQTAAMHQANLDSFSDLGILFDGLYTYAI